MATGGNTNFGATGSDFPPTGDNFEETDMDASSIMDLINQNEVNADTLRHAMSRVENSKKLELLVIPQKTAVPKKLRNEVDRVIRIATNRGIQASIEQFNKLKMEEEFEEEIEDDYKERTRRVR
ncbi:uncharacterized protein [Centruroides vittatus]|uniref:uncharacterized protein n=1 Tax=Centruroides vittatus TaxID=120091 RepID=UPI0035109B2C